MDQERASLASVEEARLRDERERATLTVVGRL